MEKNINAIVGFVVISLEFEAMSFRNSVGALIFVVVWNCFASTGHLFISTVLGLIEENTIYSDTYSRAMYTHTTSTMECKDSDNINNSVLKPEKMELHIFQKTQHTHTYAGWTNEKKLWRKSKKKHRSSGLRTWACYPNIYLKISFRVFLGLAHRHTQTHDNMHGQLYAYCMAFDLFVILVLGSTFSSYCCIELKWPDGKTLMEKSWKMVRERKHWRKKNNWIALFKL